VGKKGGQVEVNSGGEPWELTGTKKGTSWTPSLDPHSGHETSGRESRPGQVEGCSQPHVYVEYCGQTKDNKLVIRQRIRQVN